MDDSANNKEKEDADDDDDRIARKDIDPVKNNINTMGSVNNNFFEPSTPLLRDVEETKSLN